MLNRRAFSVDDLKQQLFVMHRSRGCSKESDLYFNNSAEYGRGMLVSLWTKMRKDGSDFPSLCVAPAVSCIKTVRPVLKVCWHLFIRASIKSSLGPRTMPMAYFVRLHSAKTSLQTSMYPEFTFSLLVPASMITAILWPTSTSWPFLGFNMDNLDSTKRCSDGMYDFDEFAKRFFFITQCTQIME